MKPAIIIMLNEAAFLRFFVLYCFPFSVLYGYFLLLSANVMDELSAFDCTLHIIILYVVQCYE